MIPLDLCHALVVDDSVQNREMYFPKSRSHISLAQLSLEEMKGLPGLLKSIFDDELRSSVLEQSTTLAVNASTDDSHVVRELVTRLYHGNSSLQLDIGV